MKKSMEAATVILGFALHYGCVFGRNDTAANEGTSNK